MENMSEIKDYKTLYYACRKRAAAQAERIKELEAEAAIMSGALGAIIAALATEHVRLEQLLQTRKSPCPNNPDSPI